jgi:hypothetical protein
MADACLLARWGDHHADGARARHRHQGGTWRAAGAAGTTLDRGSLRCVTTDLLDARASRCWKRLAPRHDVFDVPIAMEQSLIDAGAAAIQRLPGQLQPEGQDWR